VGSTRAGRRVGARCGERLLPCTLELGGYAAAIVDDGADLDRAARAIAYGGLANAGQSCVAVERVLAVPSVFDDLLARTSAVAARVRPGVDVASVHATQRPQIDAWRKRALDRGAIFHQGGVVDVTECGGELDSGDEIFGPLIPFTRVPSVADAVARANASAQQLCAYVFADRERGRSIARQLRAQHVVIGDAMISYAMMELPFGGHGASGFGRVHGVDGMRALARDQIIVDGHLPIRREPWWLPYDAPLGETILRGLERALSWRDRLPF
jgi:acyl-CoA reductase-like NAD-dependent aldehyde dehydrogenase